MQKYKYYVRTIGSQLYSGVTVYMYCFPFNEHALYRRWHLNTPIFNSDDKKPLDYVSYAPSGFRKFDIHCM